jgi:hypothetical protein
LQPSLSRRLSLQHRRKWKGDVVNEFSRQYGLNLSRTIGPDALRDLLNAQYKLASSDPAHDIEKLVLALKIDFGIDLDRCDKKRR